MPNKKKTQGPMPKLGESGGTKHTFKPWKKYYRQHKKVLKIKQKRVPLIFLKWLLQTDYLSD